ncbi:hypothetical protein ACFFOV_00660 [Cerasicoccus arenae]|nr:hypothetical protein [Cerasicoccus arenae]
MAKNNSFKSALLVMQEGVGGKGAGSGVNSSFSKVAQARGRAYATLKNGVPSARGDVAFSLSKVESGVPTGQTLPHRQQDVIAR